MNSSEIAIVILHHEGLKYLKMMLESISENTIYPHKIYVVDNNSLSINYEELIEITHNYSVKLIRNKNNNWIYGFNLSLEFNNDELIVLSDADIVVPKPINGICWLEYLVQQMHDFPMLGKLGLSLDLTMISDVQSLKQLYEHEIKFKKGYMIGENVIAPVDTTMAIYRKDLFISDFKMRIGHMSLIRPYYFMARSPDKFACKHLGWLDYLQYINYANPKVMQSLINKSIFFFQTWNLFSKRLVKYSPILL